MSRYPTHEPWCCVSHDGPCLRSDSATPSAAPLDLDALLEENEDAAEEPEQLLCDGTCDTCTCPPRVWARHHNRDNRHSR